SSGDDVIAPTATNEILLGMDGVDVAVYSGLRDSYQIFRIRDHVRVVGPDGADLLDSVETLRFDNGDLSIFDLNTAPLGQLNRITANEDSPLSISFADLTMNDLDREYDPLTVINVFDATHGVVSLDETAKKVVFTPSANFFGSASFQYTVSDPFGLTATSTVYVNVESVIDYYPVAVDDSFTMDEDTQLIFTKESLLSNDYSNDGRALIFKEITGSQYGSVMTNSNGDFIFTPNEDVNGVANIYYSIFDDPYGNYNSYGKIIVTIKPINDTPVSTDDAGYVVVEGNTLAISGGMLTSNDHDVDQDTLFVQSIGAVTGGEAVIDQSGNVLFTPAQGFSNANAFIEYTVSDGHGGTDTAIADVRVYRANNIAPIAVADVITRRGRPFDGNTFFSVNVAELLANDYDSEGDALSLLGISDIRDGEVWLDMTASAQMIGNEVILSIYGDAPNVLTFDYTVFDNNGGVCTGVATIHAGVNTNPSIVNDVLYCTEAQWANGVAIDLASLLTNDSDVEGDSLSVYAVQMVGVQGNVEHIIDNETFIMLPVSNLINNQYVFDYTVQDGWGGFTTGNVTVIVSDHSGIDAPIANDDTIYVTQQQWNNGFAVKNARLLANDLVKAGGVLSIDSMGMTTHGGSVYSSEFYGDGTEFYFSPQMGSYPDGQLDSFDYTVIDGLGGFATGTVTVMVNKNSGSDAPVVQDDTFYVTSQQWASGFTINRSQILANDLAKAGGVLSIDSLGMTAHGGNVYFDQSSLDGAGIFFSPQMGDYSNGKLDSFEYTVSDGLGGFATGTVTVMAANNSGVNAPTVVDDTIYLSQGQWDSLLIYIDTAKILANDSAKNGLLAVSRGLGEV
ncbi:MAG: cadherin-like domain-containing protein, partial [Magnetococcales bacterium]|nr:cadherin-like domain-containing protein [Magnetococcales bacterium]